MAAKASEPKNYNISDLKTFIFEPALTSNFEVYIQPPEKVKKFNDSVNISSKITEILLVSCSEASLPGSSLATHELNNDVTGVTQRNVYRRLYDDRTDFTFYVTADKNSDGYSEYDQIRVFERWLQYISGEQESGSEDTTLPYRVKWPDDYKTTIYITKFEKTATSKTGFGDDNAKNGSSGFAKTKLEYSFFNAYPISVSSMPVSYDSSSLLKCTVSFTYDRYVMKKIEGTSGKAFEEPKQTPATGVPTDPKIGRAHV